MPSNPSLPSLSDLLKKSREIRSRLEAQAENATELKKRVDHARKQMAGQARFYPE